ncbi:2098_t:CDS:2, partial [Scutellospora calospora]
FTIAVTQNFCSPTSIEQVWLRTRNARPKLAQKLLSKIIRLSTIGGTRHNKNFYRNLKSSTNDDDDTEDKRRYENNVIEDDRDKKKRREM